MAETKRYFWLRLKDDFFQSKRIKKLRRMAGGDTYVIIYLKMQLKSIKTGGMLRFTGIEGDFAEELALDLDEETDDVRMTLAFLQSTGLIETSDDVNFFLPFAAENTGSETASTQRSRECRARQRVALQQDCNAIATHCNAGAAQLQRECNVEIEIESEIEKEKEKEINIDSTLTTSIDTTSVDGKGTTTPTRGDVRSLLDAWNSLGLNPVGEIDPESALASAIREAIKTYGLDKLLQAVERCKKSSFLTGGASSGWTPTLNWLLRKVPKVLTGRFDDYEDKGRVRNVTRESSAAAPGEEEMRMIRRQQEMISEEDSDGMA